MISLLALTLTLRQTGPAPLVAVITGYRSYRGGWKGYRSRHRREIVISSQGWPFHRRAFHHSDKPRCCGESNEVFKTWQILHQWSNEGGREGNLFVSLGLTARVTRVQRAQVLQPLCGIIFAWIWEIQLYNASDAFSRCVRLVQEIQCPIKTWDSGDFWWCRVPWNLPHPICPDNIFGESGW